MRRRAVLALLCLGACQKSGTPVDFSRKPPKDAVGGAWVAKYAGVTLTEGELARRFAELSPYARARYQAAEQRKEYVEGLVRFELLVDEALRRGLHNDAEVVETAKRVMVQRLLAQELEERAQPPSNDEVRAYYDAHKADYVKPAMVRLAHIAFGKANREKAEAVLKEALALPPLDYAGFGRLAKEHSEEARTKPLEGDLRFLSEEELAQKYGAALVPASQALTQVGQVHPTLVETDTQLHVVKLQGRQLALNLTVEQAQPSIVALLQNESKQSRLKALLDGLKDKAGLQVNDGALAGMNVDVKAPAVETKGPQPGFVPAPVVPQVR